MQERSPIDPRFQTVYESLTPESQPKKRAPGEEKRWVDISDAVRWLRHRSRLTQREVVERVQARGQSLSDVYYAQIEQGLRKPSETLLSVVLEAIGSSTSEFATVVTGKPWQTVADPDARYAGETPAAVDAASSGSSGSALAQAKSPAGERYLSKARMRSAAPKPASLGGWRSADEELLAHFKSMSEQDRTNLMALARSRSGLASRRGPRS